MPQRVSDERLAMACEHGGHAVHALGPSEKCDLALDLRDARATLAAVTADANAAIQALQRELETLRPLVRP